MTAPVVIFKGIFCIWSCLLTDLIIIPCCGYGLENKGSRTKNWFPKAASSKPGIDMTLKVQYSVDPPCYLQQKNKSVKRKLCRRKLWQVELHSQGWVADARTLMLGSSAACRVKPRPALLPFCVSVALPSLFPPLLSRGHLVSPKQELSLHRCPALWIPNASRAPPFHWNVNKPQHFSWSSAS